MDYRHKSIRRRSPFACRLTPLVLAVTADRPVDAPVPFLPLADIGALADFVLINAVEAAAAEAFAAAAG
ncbi:MAG: hypothetical protein P4L90_05540 [Rhodopila sp.]|nr:hypothetical protein [Rhodopila sp.]